jgi:putative two-component system response regulator
MLGTEHLHDKTAKPKVLIVDDTAVIIKILKEALESDFEVCSAANGRDGLAMATSNRPPDLILLDIKMPDLGGHEFCETLKNDPVTKNIPVIFITSMAEIEDEAKGFELGAVDYIRKPFNVTVVKARVRTHTELKLHRDFLQKMLQKKSEDLNVMEREYLNLFYRNMRP